MEQKIETLVFSKDRPLQLHSYLESLIHSSDMDQKDITVITPWFSRGYESVRKIFTDVKFLFEFDHDGFSNTLKYFLNNTKKEYILFGCDDVIYKDKFQLDSIPNVIEKEQLLGFSLRLGTNINNQCSTEAIDSDKVMWCWPGSNSHWGYPFELMASVYPKHMVERIFEECESKIKSPNYLESEGTMWCGGQMAYYKPFLGMFNSISKAVAQDVNRVQNDFPNQFTGTNEQEPNLLKRYYAEGKRINWKKAWGSSDPDCFVGNKYWELV